MAARLTCYFPLWCMSTKLELLLCGLCEGNEKERDREREGERERKRQRKKAESESERESSNKSNNTTPIVPNVLNISPKLPKPTESRVSLKHPRHGGDSVIIVNAIHLHFPGHTWVGVGLCHCWGFEGKCWPGPPMYPTK